MAYGNNYSHDRSLCIYCIEFALSKSTLMIIEKLEFVLFLRFIHGHEAIVLLGIINVFFSFFLICFMIDFMCVCVERNCM